MNEYMVEALEEKGFQIEIKRLPQFRYRIVVTWKGRKAMDVVRGSYSAAVRVPYYTFIEPESQVIDRLKKRWQNRVERVKAEMQ